MKNSGNINEFSDEPTSNHTAHIKAMQGLSIVDITRAVDFINTLSQFIDADNEALDDMGDILEPLNAVIEELRTEDTCTHCGAFLYKSDLPQYDYVCLGCDENF